MYHTPNAKHDPFDGMSCRTSPIKTLYSNKQTAKYQTAPTYSSRPSFPRIHAFKDGIPDPPGDVEEKLRNVIYRLPRNGHMTPSSHSSSFSSNSTKLFQESKIGINVSRTSESGGMKYLPPQREIDKNKKTLVVDLDETLVHSCFTKPNKPFDLLVPVSLDGQTYEVYIHKRPGVDQFLRRLSPFYEIVIFTASLKNYADPLLDRLDRFGYCSYRLYRQHCVMHDGVYVKDLSKIGRELKDVIIIDNADFSYLFQPENAMPCLSWYDDPRDTELLDMIPILQALGSVRDVTHFVPKIVAQNQVLFGEAVEIIRQEKRKMLEQEVSQVIARATEETTRISSILPRTFSENARNFSPPHPEHSFSSTLTSPPKSAYLTESPSSIFKHRNTEYSSYYRKKDSIEPPRDRSSKGTTPQFENSLSQSYLARQLDAYTARSFGEEQETEKELDSTLEYYSAKQQYRKGNATPEPRRDTLPAYFPSRDYSSSKRAQTQNYQFPPSLNYTKQHSSPDSSPLYKQKSMTQVHSAQPGYSPPRQFHTRFPSMTESKYSSRSVTPRGSKSTKKIGKDIFNQTISASSHYLEQAQPKDSLSHTLYFQDSLDKRGGEMPLQQEHKTEKHNKTPPHRVNLKSSYHLLTEQIREAKKALFGLTHGQQGKLRKYATQKKIKNHHDQEVRFSQQKKAPPGRTQTISRYYSRALPEFPAQSRPSPNNIAGKREAINYSPRNEESPMIRDISSRRLKRTEKYHHQPRQLHEKPKISTGAVQIPSEMKRRFKQPEEFVPTNLGYPNERSRFTPQKKSSLTDLKRNGSSIRLSRNHSEMRGAGVQQSEERSSPHRQPRQVDMREREIALDTQHILAKTINVSEYRTKWQMRNGGFISQQNSGQRDYSPYMKIL